MSYESIFTLDLAAVRRWINSAVIWRGRPARVRYGGRHAVRIVVAFVATRILAPERTTLKSGFASALERLAQAIAVRK
jgi:hypothetical protein